MANGLDKFFRLGAERNIKGNGLIKRQMRKHKVRPFHCKRLNDKGIKTNLLNDCLVELISEAGERPEFRVSFKQRPLIDKIFTGVLMKNYEEVEHIVAKPLMDKLDGYYASLQHIHREMNTIDEKMAEFKQDGDMWYKEELVEDKDGPQRIDVTEEQNALSNQHTQYKEAQNSTLSKIKTIVAAGRRYGKMKVHYPRVNYGLVKLRVTAVVEYDTEFESYTCLAEPFDLRTVSKTVRKWAGRSPDEVPIGILKWLTKNGYYGILDA